MIELTDDARCWVQKRLAKRGHGIGIYVDVVRSGCSGFSYKVDFLDSVADGQRVMQEDGFVVVIDEDDVPMLAGVALRLEKKGLNEALAFDNPHATATCGCGSSFSV